jgi:hypothetical protein
VRYWPITLIVVIGLIFIWTSNWFGTRTVLFEPPISFSGAEMTSDGNGVEVFGTFPLNLDTYALLFIADERLQSGYSDEDGYHTWQPQGRPLRDDLSSDGHWKRTVPIDYQSGASSSEYRVLQIWFGGESCVSQTLNHSGIYPRPSECRFGASALIKIDEDSQNKRTVHMIKRHYSDR